MEGVDLMKKLLETFAASMIIAFIFAIIIGMAVGAAWLFQTVTGLFGLDFRLGESLAIIILAAMLCAIIERRGSRG